MLQDYFGFAGALVTFAGYGFYFAGIFRGRIHPHAISWLIWGVLTTIAYFAQVSDDAGPGAWVMAASAICCSMIFLASFRKGNDVTITRTDWLALAGAFSALPVWYVTNDPLWSIVIVTFIDLVGYYPTFRKTYWKPYSEGLVLYLVVIVKASLSLAAMQHFSLTNILYPSAVIVFSSVFSIFILVRRKQVGHA